MTRSELCKVVAEQYPKLSEVQSDIAIRTLFDAMKAAVCSGERIEIRGFGVFQLRKRKARTGRNPRTGESVYVPPKNVLSFKAGKDLKERLNNGNTLGHL